MLNKVLKSIRNKIGYFILPKNEWQIFSSKYKNIPRFKPGVIKFRDYSFETPDVPSILWQIKENFIDFQLKFETKKPDPIITDCGANIGITCTYFKNIYPKSKIKAFEADPKIFRYLRNNITKNQIEDGINLINKAVWTDNKGIEFSSEGADGGSVYGQNSKKIKIESVRLKDVILAEKEVDLLKIDIEGAEDAVIADCSESLKKVKNIFLEYHSHKDRRQNLDIILKTLSDNNFRYQIHATEKKTPLISMRSNTSELDLQLVIFAINANLK